MKRTLLTIVSLALLVPAASPQTVIHELIGPSGANSGPTAGGFDLNADSHPDVLVGSPGDDTAGVDAGAVRAYSGATGQVIWTRCGLSAGDGLGAAMEIGPDRNGDGVEDVVVGAPDALNGSKRTGCALVLSGTTGAILGTFWGDEDGDKLGFSVAANHDRNEDGTADVVAGAPEANGSNGEIKYWDGVTGSLLSEYVSTFSAARWAYALCSGDFDGDGVGDLAVGVPFITWSGPSKSGAVFLYRGGGAIILSGLNTGEAFGSALAFGPDLDGDGNDELIVGVPRNSDNGTWAGAVRLFSLGTVLRTWRGDAGGDHFGTSVARLDDLDGDGIEEIAAGAPGTLKPGYARVVSTKFNVVLFDVDGSQTHQEVGSHVANVGDVNQDGVGDLGVGDTAYPSGGSGSETGRVLVVSGGCPGFVSYCTAGTSASGCVPALSASGTPSAALALPFQLQASGVEGGKDGLFFFGSNGRQANSWGNGTSYQCVVPPVRRGGLLGGVGTPGACDGAFAQDLNALWQANPAKNPGAGAVVQAQLWYRDPFSTSNQTTSLSGAIEFAVCP